VGAEAHRAADPTAPADRNVAVASTVNTFPPLQLPEALKPL